ncbi:hypothetical protein BVRB_6g142380 isoform A [Beta vulgaris subsp. vulgaris]|uniref:uncharacterized protein LOC104896564 isoform X4 n=1 Tax=Beta vulgaris subsp. vulgaris TaxID=3555 RepID=UPI00053F9E29|nr:uncharacterized protein LOC104896564 isoform X4 [Beta vulgaris subsp. vulgaris]KMT08220.1 hypothetical protein BVRB_6g142380 isoform A [Beta vulgaris subsp. vulgaris]
MNEQEEYMDLCEAAFEQVDGLIHESHPGIQPSYSLLGLPEMSLQPSISYEVELMGDVPEPQDKQKVHGVELSSTQKDKASVLEEAANHVKALKLQVETMTKAREGEFLSRYMPYVGTPIIQFQSPRQCVPRSAGPSTGTGIGMPFGVGICQSCSCACAPYIHLPPGISNPYSASMMAAYPLFPAVCSTQTVISQSDGNCSSETEPCSEVHEQLGTGNDRKRSATHLKQ